MAAEQNPELSIPSPIGKQPSEVESLSVAGAKRSVNRKGWEEVMKSEFDGHTKTGTFSMVDRVQPSEVESLSVAGIERSVFRKGWEEVMKSEFDGHTKTGTFSMVDRVPKGRKPVKLEVVVWL